MKIALIGSGGRLGAALAREYRRRFQVTAFDHKALDVGDERQLRGKLEPLDVDLMINCAALTNVDYCETHRDEAIRINAEAPRLLAEVCKAKDARLIHISTDYVFDGEKREAYSEEDPANAISVYGDSKLQGEKNVLATDNRHLVIRVSWVFGPDRPSFIDAIIKRARESDSVDAIGDKFAVPTYTSDVAALLPALFDSNTGGGVLHLTNTGECSWQQYGQWALDCCREQGIDLKAHTVAALRLSDMKNFVARRPVYSVLSPDKYAKLTGTSPRPWREAVADYIKHSYLKT